MQPGIKLQEHTELVQSMGYSACAVIWRVGNLCLERDAHRSNDLAGDLSCWRPAAHGAAKVTG